MSERKCKQGAGKRLNDADRFQKTQLLSSHNPPSMRKIARNYDVNEKIIRKINVNNISIQAQIEQTDELSHTKIKCTYNP